VRIAVEFELNRLAFCILEPGHFETNLDGIISLQPIIPGGGGNRDRLAKIFHFKAGI
jgi:hypothetical protein